MQKARTHLITVLFVILCQEKDMICKSSAFRAFQQITNFDEFHESHLHICVILNHQRGYQNAFYAMPYAVSPLPTCMNQYKKYVALSKVTPLSFHYALMHGGSPLRRGLFQSHCKPLRTHRWLTHGTCFFFFCIFRCVLASL